jgi:putative SOS response-associated peptidase YedK
VCGRLTLKTPLAIWVRSFFDLPVLGDLPSFQPRYNIAPSQAVLVARWDSQHHGLLLEYLQWGLVPSWADDRTIANRLINARWETLAEKPSFREPFRHGRCLVLADGYYEWKAAAEHPKQPFWVHRPDESPFAMAAIAACNRRLDPRKPLRSVAIVTRPSIPALAPIHQRMPMVLQHQQQLKAWLAEGKLDPAVCQKIFDPLPPDYLDARPVSDRVNRPAHDDPECLLKATMPA